MFTGIPALHLDFGEHDKSLTINYFTIATTRYNIIILGPLLFIHRENIIFLASSFLIDSFDATIMQYTYENEFTQTYIYIY